MVQPDLTVCIGSLNTRIATEVTIRSLRANTAYPFSLKVGDCGSTDGSIDLLQKFEHAGALELEIAPEGRSHGAWIDHWRSTTRTRWLLISDSDIEYHDSGWLDDMVEAATTEGAALTTAAWCEAGEYTEPATGFTMSTVERPLAYLLLIDHQATRHLEVSFDFQLLENDDGGYVAYDTAALFARATAAEGLGTFVMPADFGRCFTHYGAQSWGRDRSRLPQSFLRREYVKARMIPGRLRLRRRRKFWRRRDS